jgi:guanylate kinase (EC 2.7.4.8)
MVEGRLFILSGPAGTGKGTLRERLFAAIDTLSYSVSCTTRLPRPGEVDGKDYFFISEPQFLKMVDEGGFLEWAHVHKHLYGTPTKEILEAIGMGKNVVIEVDVQGARQIREKLPQAIGIFIRPPSMEDLERRLRSRGTEDEQAIAVRLTNAQYEMSSIQDYQYVIVNDDVERASAELIHLVQELIKIKS